MEKILKILHVEDSPDDNLLAASKLKRVTDGIEITWVDSAIKALEAINEQNYDCILSDYQMPEMDGLALLQAVRKESNSIPFIFLTGQGNEKIAANALRAGANDYFPKNEDIVGYRRLANSIKAHVEANDHHLEKEHLRDSIDYMIQTTSFATGQDYFDILVKCLAEISKSKYAFIGKLLKDNLSIETISVWAKNEIVDNFNYDLRGTPCAEVVGKVPCVFPNGVQALFPEDTLLVDMGVQSYIGIPLFDSTGKPNGISVVMHNKPLPEASLLRSIMIAISTRASTEIERQHNIRLMKENELMYKSPEEIASLSHWQYNSQNEMIRITGKVLKVIGDDIDRLEVTLDLFNKTVYPQDRDRIRTSLRKCADSPGNKVKFQFRLQDANGEIKYFRASAAALLNNDNPSNPIEYYGIMEDVTDEFGG